MKYLKIIFLNIFLILSMVAVTPVYAKVDKSNVDKDPLVGKASNDIERMIEAGKGLIGSVNYYMENHARTNKEIVTFDYEKVSTGTMNGQKMFGIDCSEFVAYALSKGYGLQWGSDNVGAPTTHSMTETSHTPKEYLISVKSDFSNAKRGDIVFTNDWGHVVIYLGDGLVLGSNGTNDTNASKGPSIAEGKYMPPAGNKNGYNAIRFPDNVKNVKFGNSILQKGHPSDDLSFKSGGNSKTESSEKKKEESKFVGEDSWKNKMVNFQNNVYKNTFKGLETGSEGFINNAFILGITNMSDKTLKMAYIVMMFLTTGLFLFMGIMTMVYLVILPNGLGGYKLAEFFEKTTGMDSAVTRKNTFDLIGRLGITTVILAIMYANALPVIISGFLKFIIYFTTIF